MGFIPVNELITRPRLHGGTIRFENENHENTTGGNLLALGGRLASDISGNRFGMQLLLPINYFEKFRIYLRQNQIIMENCEIDEFGGYLGLLQHSSISNWSGDTILIYTPHNDLVWSVDIGTEHSLIRREAAVDLVGINKGFDLIVPYHPMIGYAPPRILLEWVDQGYKSPVDILKTIALMPTKEKLELVSGWEALGYHESLPLMLEHSLITSEELALEAHTHNLALQQPRNESSSSTFVDGEFTTVEDNRGTS